MKSFRVLCLALVGGVLVAVPACARARAHADPNPKPAAKSGGHFDVEEVKNVAYYDGDGADRVKHKLDLYLPKGQKDFPVLLFVHGGGWTTGDKWLYGGIGRRFAENGIGTVVTNYRLSPGVKHPEHIKDVARAFAWTHENIARYGGKPDEIFLSGHSAGGHLVALLATDESYLKAEKCALADVKGVIPVSGVYRIGPPILFQKTFGDADACKEASPLEHVGDKHPPFLIMYGDKDFPTCDRQSEDMCAALQKAKCEASSLKIEGRDHIAIVMRIVNQDDDVTQAALEFIAKHSSLKLTPVEQKKDDKP
jgi:acetyl esterase/lipase